MSTQAHTPGPWRTFIGNPSKIEIICGDRLAPSLWPSAGIRVAEIRFRRQGRGGAFSGNAVDAANARLIAASPDMLAVLKAFEYAENFGADETDHYAEALSNASAMMRKAIAKAEGQS